MKRRGGPQTMIFVFLRNQCCRKIRMERFADSDPDPSWTIINLVICFNCSDDCASLQYWSEPATSFYISDLARQN